MEFIPQLKWLWVSAIAAGLLAAAVKRGDLATVDRGVAAWMATIRSPSGDAAAKALTFFGSSPWMLVIIVGMGTWWILARRRSRIIAFTAAGSVGLLIEACLRLWVGQWRPDTSLLSSVPDLLTRFEWAGFPSGHGFRSAFLYGWWAQALAQRKASLPAASPKALWAMVGIVSCGMLIVAVGFTRVYLGRHWCSDILGAWLVALTALALASAWSHRG